MFLCVPLSHIQTTMDSVFIQIKKRPISYLSPALIFILSLSMLSAQETYSSNLTKEWQALSIRLHQEGIHQSIANQYETLHYKWKNSFNNAEEFASGGNFNFFSDKYRKSILDTIFQRDCEFVENNNHFKDSLLKAKILFYVARSQFFLRSFRPALSCFDKALSFSGTKDESLKNDILEATADTYEEIAEYQIAIAYYQFLLPKYIRTYGKIHHRTALLYEKIGICYSHIEDERKTDTIYGQSINSLAHNNFLKAYQTNMKVFAGKNRYAAINLFQLGINTYYKINYCQTKQRTHYIDSAISLLKRAAIYIEKYYPEEVKLGNIYNSLSFCYLAKGKTDSLHLYLSKSYKSHLKNRGKHHPMTILAALYLSYFNFPQKPDSALVYLQKAMSYCVPEFHPRNIFENPDETLYIIDDFMFSLINDNKIERFVEMYNNTKQKKYLYAATNTAKLNLKTGRQSIKKRHLSAEFGDWSKELNKKSKQVFRTYILKYQNSFSPETLDSALNLLEENNMYSNVLKENIATYKQTIQKSSFVNTQGQIALLTKKILNALKAKKYDTLIDLQRKYLRLSFRLEKMTQSLLSSRSNIPKTHYSYIPISGLQQRLRHSTYLRYIVMPDEIGVVGINQDTAIYIPLQVKPDSLRKMAGTFYREITDPNYSVSKRDIFPRQAWHLFQVLFPPGIKQLLDNTKRLFITPEDFLLKLPFETLLTEREVSKPVYYNKLPYLIKQCSIAEVAGISHFVDGSKHITHRLKYVGFAPGFRGHQKLHSNIAEIQKIANIFGGKVISGTSANKKNFLSYLDSADIIQISTHYTPDMNNPLNSSLILDSTPEGNNLSITDIYANKTDAGLIILSACQTGNGKILQGEGVMSFAKTLECAGADCIISSIWDADDNASKQILCRFAENINRKKSIESALRDAKLEYIASTDATFAHPYYWANYQIQGDGTQTFLKKGRLQYIIAFSLLLILLLILWKAFR